MQRLIDVPRGDMSAIEQVLEASLTAQPFLVTGRLLDRIPEVDDPLGAAFSIRRLYTRYRGPILRVRRSSDNAERDIGFLQTELDAPALESFCAGFQGYVTVWYDQTGNERHARQTDISLQPQIVQDGAIIRDALNNYAVRFNGAYLTTDWEPQESELKDGSAMLAVTTPSTGVQGQTGSVQTFDVSPPIDEDDYPEYPFDKLPIGTDIHNLDATFIPGVLQNIQMDPERTPLFRPRSLSMYVGRDKRVRMVDVANRNVSTLEAFDANDPESPPEPVSAEGGPSVLQADVIPFSPQGTAPNETQWWRGIVGVDGRVYGIPYNATTVMVIDPAPEDPTDRVSFLSFPDGTIAAQKEKYRGAALHDNGRIYCAPWNATRILSIDTNPDVEPGDRVTFFDESYITVPSEPAFSSIVYVHPKLYCVPYGASQVMVLNPEAPQPADPDETPNIRYAADVERTLDGGSTEIEVANLEGSGKFTDGTIIEGDVVAVPGSAGTFLRVTPDSDPATRADRVTVFGTTGTDARITNSGNGYWWQPDNQEAEVPLRFEVGFTKREADRAQGTIRVSPTRVVTGVNITNNGGSGYISAPSFRFGSSSNIRGASTGSRVMEDVFEEVDGEQVYRGQRVKSIQLTNCGEGYSGTPSFGVTSSRSGKGSDAILRAEIDFTSALRNLITINVERGGSGFFYRENVSITIDAPPSGGERAQARVETWRLANENDDPERPQNGWAIESVALTNAGRGYRTRPSVRVSGGKGSTVSSSASSSVDGHVRRILPPLGGIGTGFVVDQSPSPIQIEEPLPGGIPAAARVSSVSNVNGAITGIEVTNGGQGYVEKPRAFVVVDGTEIELEVEYRNHGRLSNFAMGDPGFGYTQPPSVTIDPDQLYERPGNNRTGSIASRLEPPGTSEDVISDERWSEVHANDEGTIAYGVPFNTWRTVRIQVIDGSYEAELSDGRDLAFMGDQDPDSDDFEVNFSEAKWARGVVSNNRLWCIPFSDNRVLAINYDDTGALNTTFYGSLRGQWNSATRGERGGVIYAFPASGDSVLVLDPRQPTRIETLRYGNLRGEGARFSDGVTIPLSKNPGFGGIMYAIPDQSPDVAEINPGVPLRSVDLPPPHVILYDATGENDPNQRSIVAFAPTSENGMEPGRGLVQVVDFRNRDHIERWTLEVDKRDGDEGIPWFAEGVALEEETWPDGHSENQTGTLRAAFLPYWNSNSDYGYEGRIGILTVHLEPRKVQVGVKQTGTEPTTGDPILEPVMGIDTDFPAITGLSWEWTTSQVDIERACPFPSRSGVCLGPNVGNGRVVAWVPRETEQAMVTLDLGEDNPEVKIGEGQFAESAKRNESFVDWASGQTDRNGIATVTFPTPSSARQIETVDSFGSRVRYCAGIYTNGRVICMPTRRGAMVIREIDPTATSPWNPGAFQLNVRSLLESESGLADFWNFAGAVHVPSLNLIYAIPYRYDGILEYNTVEKIANTFGNELFRTTIRNSMLRGRKDRRDDFRYYWGGVFDGRYVYCIPYNTRIILRIDPFEPNLTRRFDTTLLTPSGEFEAYRHAIVASDRIYFIPFRASRILEVDPTNPLGATRQYVGPDLGGGDKWSHAVIAPDGNVYGVPWRSGNILKLTPRRGTTDPQIELIPHGQRGIWSAGSIGVDGNMYMVPYRARGVLVFDPRTRQRFQIGRFDTRGRYERNEQWIDCVDLPTNEIFAIPASRRLGLRVFPEGNTIGTMDFRNQGRTFRTSALVQREFRSRPERFVGRTPSGIEQTYTVFFGDQGYAIHAFDRNRNVGTVAFGPRFENGVTSLVLDRSRQGLPMLFTLRPEFAFETTFFIGGIAGLLTAEETNEFAMMIEGGTYRFVKGTGENRIINLFNVVFGEGNTGVVSTFSYRRGSQGVMETFLRGIPVNLTEYTFQGDASGGAYVQIGRVDRVLAQPESGELLPKFITQFTGTISELVMFTSDQRDLGTELGRLQTNSYNAF